MRNGTEHVAHVAANGDRRSNDRAVAVFHAVSATPRQVVAEKRIRAGVEFRELTEHRRLLQHDLLCGGCILVHISLGCVVVDGGAYRERLAVGVFHGERAQRVVAQLRGTVHEVLQVRRGERPRILGWKKLGRDLPRRLRGSHEGDADRTRVQLTSPYQRRGHVHVRVRRVDSEVGAVHHVAEHFVGEPYRTVVIGDVPLVRIRAGDRQLPPAAVVGVNVEHVFRIFVDGVSAGRRSAHPRFEHASCELTKRDFNLGVMMLRSGKRHFIDDGRLRSERCGEQKHNECGTNDLTHRNLERRC